MKTALLLSTTALLITGSLYLMADDDHERYKSYEHYESYRSTAVPVPAASAKSPEATLYGKECGSCHMAYQPELLPKRSWEKMMKTLDDHFGVDATLDEGDALLLTSYLVKNAGDAKPVPKDFAKIVASIPAADAPLRISKTRYFVKEHREIPQRFIDQKEVKSIANCNACHQDAAAGDYSERSIFIPNYGRWDD